MKSNKTSFKKGQKPPNWKPIGSERTYSKDGYILIKVAEGMHQWKLQHRVVWEAANGKLPKGALLSFKDQDKTNCNLDNLEVITMGENAVRNKYQVHKFPVEMHPIIKTKIKLLLKTNELRKKVS